MKKNILLWGNGARTAWSIEKGYYKDCNILAIVTK